MGCLSLSFGVTFIAASFMAVAFIFIDILQVVINVFYINIHTAEEYRIGRPDKDMSLINIELRCLLFARNNFFSILSTVSTKIYSIESVSFID